MTDDLKSLAEAISQLNAMQDEDNDHRAAGLYRAMFHVERDVNFMDYNYADHILGYVEFGVENAEIDYRNYLGYLKKVIPAEYQSHKDMFEEAIRNRDDENLDEEDE